MDDLISRQAAIMAVKTGALSGATLFGRTDEGATAYYETVKAIKALPSAQPETHDKRTETHACDLISRQAAIDAVAKWFYDVFGIKESDETATIFKRLRELPAAQPERKRGRWIPHEDEDGEHYGDKCSECGEWYVMPFGKTNFCPNCGARMDGGESDED